MISRSLFEAARHLGLCAALVCGTAQAATATVPVTVQGDDQNGMRVIHARALGAGDTFAVQARLSRTRANRVLSPQPLRFRVLSAAGEMRSETLRTIGPAQLPRGNVRDHYVRVELAALPGDSVVVDWPRAD